MSLRRLAFVILVGAAVLGGLSGYLFAGGATWEGAGVIACAFVLVAVSAWTATWEEA